MKMTACVCLVLGLMACTSSKKVVGPDGREWYAITCHRTQMNCVEEAGNLCPSGYDSDRESGGSTPFAIDNGVGGTTKGSTYKGEMLVRCH